MMLYCLIFLLVLSKCKAIDVDFKGDWYDGVGWKMLCSWSLPQGDRLQSVKLCKSGQQFKNYRPQMSGPLLLETFNTSSSLMKLECQEKSRNGFCVLIDEPVIAPPSIQVYDCEVSGEWPHFWRKNKIFEAKPFVRSGNASITADEENSKTVLNCSASGLPGPTLTWKVGGENIDVEKTYKSWNNTTKLIDVWSTIDLDDNIEEATCAPVQNLYNRATHVGGTATYLRSQAHRLHSFKYAEGLSSLIILYLSRIKCI